MKIIKSRNENNKNSNKMCVWVQSIEIYLFYELSYNAWNKFKPAALVNPFEFLSKVNTDYSS
jgi:hypothetical protein